MDSKISLVSANISTIYAISLTPEKKKQLMRRIHQAVNERSALSAENVRTTCNYLNQCFQAEPESIVLAMEIVGLLLSRRVAEGEVVKSYRKLLTYVSSTLHESFCGKIALQLSSISKIALQSASICPDDFPVAILKCILVLMYRLPIAGTSDRNALLEALRSTLHWAKDAPALYTRYGLGSLVRGAIASTDRLPDDLAVVAEQITLARHILDTFYNPQTNDVHPVEVLLRSAYDKIFNRLVSEWTDMRCYELLLYVLFDFLKREICPHLRLDIVRTLADAAGGGMRRLVRLLCVPKHVRDPQLRRKLKIMLTIIMAHSLYRYEPAVGAPRFHEFFKTIQTMVHEVDLDETVRAKFLCLNLPRTGLSLWGVCFVFIVRHLELLEGGTGGSTELDYVYNLIASVNIVYHKRWKLPNFVVKHFIDGLSRFSKTELFEKNLSDREKKLKVILSTACPSAGVQVEGTVANIFGRLPATLQRIQWIRMQSDDLRVQFVFHRQLDILQECYIAAGDDGLVHSLLAIFKTDTLLSVLSAAHTSPVARRNAAVLLSRCSLTGPALGTVLDHIVSSQGRQQSESTNPGAICNWVRAVHGSVQALNDESKRVLWSALATTLKTPRCSDEQRLLLVDTKATLLVSMMAKQEGKVVEMHVECTNATTRTTTKRKHSQQNTT